MCFERGEMVHAFEIDEGPAAAHCSELVTHGSSFETSGYAGHSEERLPHCKVAAPLPVEKVGDDGAVGCCQRTPELSARSLQGNETRATAFQALGSTKAVQPKELKQPQQVQMPCMQIAHGGNKCGSVKAL